jgi:hypothetical protein
MARLTEVVFEDVLDVLFVLDDENPGHGDPSG